MNLTIPGPSSIYVLTILVLDHCDPILALHFEERNPLLAYLRTYALTD
jgi:hypothetical protein